MPMREPNELERYARHIVLREVGGPGQAKLKAARVLVVGAGGLGAPVLLYLPPRGGGATRRGRRRASVARRRWGRYTRRGRRRQGGALQLAAAGDFRH